MTQNESWQSSCPEDNKPVPSLRSEVQQLIDEVRTLREALKRKKIRDGIRDVTFILLVLFLGYYFFVDLPDRRTTNEQNSRELACYAVRLRPPGYSETTDALRRKYDCPPFDPAIVPSGTPFPSREPTPGATVTRTAAAPATRTVTAPNTRSAQAGRPGVTVTRTVQAAGRPAVTRVVTRPAATRTVVRRTTVTATPTCVLGRVLC